MTSGHTCSGKARVSMRRGAKHKAPTTKAHQVKTCFWRAFLTSRFQIACNTAAKSNNPRAVRGIGIYLFLIFSTRLYKDRDFLSLKHGVTTSIARFYLEEGNHGTKQGSIITQLGGNNVNHRTHV